MNRKRVKREICAAALITAAVILKCARTQNSQLSTLAKVDSCILRKRTADATNGLVLEAELGADTSISINSWEKDGVQWIFLPSIFCGQEVACGNGTLVLEEGEYLLELDDHEKQLIHIMFGSEIPFACVETESGDLEYLKENKGNKETGSLCFIGEDQSLEYAGNLSKIKIRGNATRLQPKSPFRIGLEENASLAGLDASEDYVLLAEYGDISLLRNRTALELASSTTDLYEPEGQPMDLYVNGDYMGVYLLCEGISLGENRLDINDMELEEKFLNSRELSTYGTFAETDGEETLEKGYNIPKFPSDISGGYLLELEYPGRYEGEESTGFRTDRDKSLVIKEPSYASREQVEYIRDRFQRVENAMYADDWTDPQSGETLSELVDMESLVHKYLIDEICMNTDLWTSQFLYKDKDNDKFYFGPVWDYDMAFGHYDEGFSPSEFYANCHIWYGEVYDNPEFQEILRRVYKEVYLPILQELADATLEEWQETLEDSAQMNFIRWNIEDIYDDNSIIRSGDTFDECVDSLKNFIEERTEFLSSQWLDHP